MYELRFRRFAVFTLAFTLAVILWGAYVRASGSGAGCGNHWPTCNGEIIPRPKSIETIIEFVHRTTSGIAFLLVLVQLIWALRAFPRGHGVRRAAGAAMVLMVTEALVGAGLVVFEMVAENKSVARAAWMAVHLLNTFALVSALTLAIRAAGPVRASPAPGTRAGLSLGLLGLLVVAISGSVAALGDTLFRVQSLAQGLTQDLSPAAHVFVRLRVWHPVFALVVGTGLLVVTGRIVASDRPAGARPLASVVAALVLAQLAVGLVNLGLLAPIPLQIVHLLLADLLWIALVFLRAQTRISPSTPH